MSKLTKRLLCIAVMALAVISLIGFGFAEESQPSLEPECYEHGDVNGDGKVNNKDAIYILYSYLFDGDPYPIHQHWDYNNDSSTDNRDAIYVMYHYMFEGMEGFEEEYKLLGRIHDYYDPVWKWDEESNTAEVTFKCGCGQPEIYTTGAGVTVTEGEKVESTCIAAGSQSYTASVTVDGQEYTNTYTKKLPAGGHEMVGQQDCENGSACANCDYTLEALGHNWTLDSTEAATCNADAYQTYRCSECQKTNVVTLEGTSGHSMRYDEDVQDGCKFTKWYKCANCDHTAPGSEDEVYYQHTYTATLTKEATCVSAGEKTYTCAGCNDSYTEPVATNDSHDWVKGATVDGVTTHTCSRCDATKTTVEATKDTALSTNELKDNEVQLADNASVKLDEKTVDALEKDIKINVETVDPDAAGLTQEQQEQIGNAKVYDFTMTYDDGSEITDEGTQFAGEVTVSLPYTLEEGEDVDSINVWYIDDEGKLTAVEATYSNGFVTFTTNHFSYYTVTRLTPAERCELYGHAMVTREKAVTCTEDGYETVLCQRCGDVEKDVTVEHAGHNFKETVTAEATCEKAGAFENVCQTCGVKSVGEIPAKGHKMDQTQTVDASCEQVGKIVSVCANDCGYTKEEVIPQLKHVYQVHEDTEPSCSAKGVYSKKCKLCGDVVVVEERLPLGHQFDEKNVVWNWSENYLEATVTLVCSDDSAHTKTLNAVITEETERAASCTASGKITYTAEASYNDVSYSDKQEETVSELGHIPGNELQSNATQHYYSCNVCGQKIDTAAHSWNDGSISKAPTCADDGEMIVECLICQYEIKKTLPATKEHTYVDGVCSSCGHDESGCFHWKVTETEVDVSALNLCEGTNFTKYSCDCGENTYYNWNIFCEYGEEKEETVTIDGEEYTKYIYTCDRCGMVMEAIPMTVPVPGECAQQHVEVQNFIKDGQQFLSFNSAYMVEPHPGATLVETVDLTDEKYGLCGEKLEFYVCGCEQKVRSILFVEMCNWDYMGYDGALRESTYQCKSCDAVRKTRNDWSEDPENCTSMDRYTYTYLVDGEEVYTVTIESPNEFHSFEAVKYELFGDSCEDGIYIQMECRYCGERVEDFIDWHEQLVEEVTDLTDAPICAVEMITSKCPCGATWESTLRYDGDNQCDWENVSNTENATINVCGTCGVTSTDVRTITKDQHCNAWVEQTETYTDASGNVIAVGGYRYGESGEHDYQVTEAVLENPDGDCEDGVKITYICNDCGDSYTGRISYHNYCIREEYDLASLGLCQDGIAIERCACGKNSGYNWINDNNACNWQQTAGDRDGEYDWVSTYRCTQCGAVYVEQSVGSTTEDPCRIVQTITISFYENQEATTPLRTVGYKSDSTSHDMLASFQLNDSQQGCAGGYTVIQTCRNCGYSDTWYRPSDMNHDWYRVGTEQITDGQLCNEIFRVTYSCACGAESHTEVQYEGESFCNWQPVDYDTYQCSQCRVMRTETYTRMPVAGTCQVREGWKYTFTRDGQELFSYTQEHVNYDHSYEYTFQMNGTTCEEGFMAFGRCIRCDETTQSGFAGCSVLPVERIIAVDDENCCGIIELVHRRCPCGRFDHWEMYSDCSWERDGENEEGDPVYICRDCGTILTERETQTRVPDTCTSQIAIDNTYVVGDQTYTLQKTYIRESHNTVATFNCLGDSCEDGYIVIWKCQDCDYTEGSSDTNYDSHQTYRTAYYELQDYGMCGGEIWSSGCACGLESSWSWQPNSCNYSSTGNTDPDTGKTEYYCQDCQMYFSWGESGEVNPETCTFEGTFVFKLRNAEETLFDLNGRTSRKSHSTRGVDGVLLPGSQTCEDGVRLTWQCRYCDYSYETNEYYHYGCEEIYFKTACGGSVKHTVCACGKSNYVEYGCPGMTGGYSEETDENGIIHQFNEGECKNCGLYVKNEWYDVVISGCDVVRTEIYTVRYDGKTYDIRYTEEGKRHTFGDETASLMPGAQTCEDGVTVTRTCTVCGYGESSTTYSHNKYRTMREDLKQYGACGGELRIYACPCGDQKHYELNRDGCNYNGESWTETGADGTVYEHYEAKCTKCGLTEKRVWTEEATEDPCEFIRNLSVTVTCGTYSYSEQQMREYFTEHDHVQAVTLLPGSQTCEDGIQIVNTCKRCDYYNDWTSNDHRNIIVADEDLTKYGACGGKLYVYSCACGYDEGFSLSWDNCVTISNAWTETGADGLEYQHREVSCKKCDQYMKQVHHTESVGASCTFRDYTTVTVTCGDYAVTQELIREYDSHNYTKQEVVLQAGAKTCEDGIAVTETCGDCGFVYTWTTGHHWIYTQETFDLAEQGACGGVLNVRGCVCGERRSCDLNWDGCYTVGESYTEIGADGYEYIHEIISCRKCGLRTECVSHYEPIGEPCQLWNYATMTVTCGEFSITRELTSTVTDHDYVETRTLMEGSTSCEDGVKVIETCRNCNYHDEWTSTSHSAVVQETYDLTEYGAVCSGNLEYFACACGKVKDMRFSSDLLCDLDKTEIECWIPDDLNDYQDNIDYNNDAYSYSYLYRCAVTDPVSCPLTIRSTTYWILEDNCNAVEYEIWQLGYDEETDTCLKELKFATGSERSWHDYEDTSLDAYDDDGNRVQGGRLRTCKRCQSTNTDRYTYDENGNKIGHEFSFVNTLDNGESKSYAIVRTYEQVGTRGAQCVLERREGIRADGSQYWEQDAYTYDLANCVRIREWSNSIGDFTTSEEKYHGSITWHREDKQVTCSQAGYYHEWSTCDSCGMIDYQYYEEYKPGHSWEKIDDNLWKCDVCGLENTNGADGSVILEDLTETYGNGTEYVIGYYKPEYVPYGIRISVVLEDLEEGDNLIDLDINEFNYKTTKNDGYNGMSFNKATADEAAKAAVASISGYEGTYAIRVTFIPLGGDDTLDYAITLDSVAVE